MRPVSWKGSPAVLLAAALAAAPGCGDHGLADASGVVTLDGKPLASGSVVFIGAGTSAPVVATIGPDGRYSARDVPTGTVTVTVHSPNPKAEADEIRAQSADRAKEVGKPAPPPAPDAKNWFPIPERYGDPTRSGLSYPLKPGANTVNVELKSQG